MQIIPFSFNKMSAAFKKSFRSSICAKTFVPVITDTLPYSFLILSANYANENWKKWYDKLINNTELIHLADAKGIDGEGIELGTGELGNFSYLIKNKNVKVLETWQGHLNNGSEFFNTIKYLIKNYG